MKAKSELGKKKLQEQAEQKEVKSDMSFIALRTSKKKNFVEL